MLTGAGADRMQTGMSRSFGKTMGRAAFVKPGQTLYIIGAKNTKAEVEARKLIRSIKARLPCKVVVKSALPKQSLSLKNSSALSLLWKNKIS